MTDSAKQVAEEAERRLDDLAENVRDRFDRLTRGRSSHQIKAGRFSGQAGGIARSRVDRADDPPG